MRPIMRLILGLCALVVILAGVALALPGHVTVARSVVINAPEPVIFPYLNNLHRFGDWSPWAARDPQLTVAYSGPEQGKGAKVEWTSNKPSVGAGSMEIVESSPNRHIDLAVSFNGLDGTSYYEVVPSGSGSKVTWGFGYELGTSSAQALEGFAARSLYRGRIPRRSRQAEGQDRDRAEAGGANAAERDDRAGAAWRSRARCRARRRRAGHSRAGGGASCRAAASSAYGNRSGSDPSYAAAGSAAGAGGFFNADTYQEAKTSVRDSG